MIKQKSLLLVLLLFTVAIITITAYATVAATNTTANNPNAKIDTEDVDITYSAWLSNKSETSTVQVRILDNASGIGNHSNIGVEVNAGDGWQTWKYSQSNSEENEGKVYDTLSLLTGNKPLINKKVNYTPVIDAIGQQEAQFGNIQEVTLYGDDNATVMEYYGYGDCWADSCWLYNKLSEAGVPVRIMAYVDGGIDDGYRHTWIEINIGNGWETWNYTKYNSQHAGDNGYGTPYVLIEPGNAPADILKTGY